MEPKELVLGGQAVIEGVMMKGPERFAVAVRKASGEIRVKEFPTPAGGPARTRMSKLPLLRGVVTMAAMLVIGYRALQYSADEAMEDAETAERGAAAAPREEAGRGGGGLAMAGALALALLLGIGLFFWLPLLAARGVADVLPALSGRLAFNLVDGVLRLLAFVGYVAGISMMKDIRRIFQYHGAEHKVVNAYERKAELSPAAVAAHSNLHPRCGTSFLLFVMAISGVLPDPPRKLPVDEGAHAPPAPAGDRRHLLRSAPAVGEEGAGSGVPGARRAGDAPAAAHHPRAGPLPDRGGDRLVPAGGPAPGPGGSPCGISWNR
jgi:uncharacterized protein YqhQ